LRKYVFQTERPAERERAGDVVLFSAPGEGREAVEIVRRVLDEAGRGVPFDQIAVFLRTPQQYLGLLEHACARGGVPVYFDRGTRRPDPAGRAFVALLSCAVDGLSAKRFDEYLSLGQVPQVAGQAAAPGLVTPLDDVFDDEERRGSPGPQDAWADAQVVPPHQPIDSDDEAVVAGTLYSRVLVPGGIAFSRGAGKSRAILRAVSKIEVGPISADASGVTPGPGGFAGGAAGAEGGGNGGGHAGTTLVGGSGAGFASTGKPGAGGTVGGSAIGDPLISAYTGSGFVPNYGSGGGGAAGAGGGGGGTVELSAGGDLVGTPRGARPLVPRRLRAGSRRARGAAARERIRCCSTRAPVARSGARGWTSAAPPGGCC
jgi:hypothetical protein